MKFKSDAPNLIVWNPEENKVLCEFVNGEYETTSKKEIQILDVVTEVWRDDGSEPDLSEPLEHAEPALEDLSVKQLKEFAKENGLEIPKKAKTKKEILAAVLEAQESLAE